jgi:alkanesulfonate monooxygenase SsuD/methylene tetrahydromethanopterin reductase-like flavin-dependent oxidoreductase (luciferase family)
VLAKTLGAIDLLSGGRLVVGVGAGSSERDYEAVGIPFEERWPRFDESIRTLRALWDPARTFDGEFYSTEDISLEPAPAQENEPPIWIGSWGSKIGLRRVARLGDGWLASGYNTTPERFQEGRAILETELSEVGKDPDEFPNAIATMFVHVTEDEAEASRVIDDTLAPMLDRPAEELAERLPIGSPETCAKKLAAYQVAGVDRVYLWPIEDELNQLRTIRKHVIPAVEDCVQDTD